MNAGPAGDERRPYIQNHEVAGDERRPCLRNRANRYFPAAYSSVSTA